ncbi:MAG: hypothetical protein R3E01_36225 [Pirellulaceae bacterium]|nr:hypothetical protein [Planctomycetales bacterium]
MTMDETQEDVTTAANVRPASRFVGSGGLSVAVWTHKNENGTMNYSVRLDRSYKDNDGNYHSTPYLRDGDLLRAQKLLERAGDWIEQQKQQHRGQASAQAR